MSRGDSFLHSLPLLLLSCGGLEKMGQESKGIGWSRNFSVSDWHQTGQRQNLSARVLSPALVHLELQMGSWRHGTYDLSPTSGRLYKKMVARGNRPGRFPDQEISLKILRLIGWWTLAPGVWRARLYRGLGLALSAWGL